GQFGDFTIGGSNGLRFGTRVDFLDRDATPLVDGNSGTDIAIDPTNPLRMSVVAHHTVAGVIQADFIQSRSADGGRTWTTQSISSATDGLAGATVRTSPTTSYDRFGNLYVAYVAQGPAANQMTVFCLQSVNNGVSWASVRTVFG